MRTTPFLLDDRPSRSRIAVSIAAPATAAISTGRNASESGSIAHEMMATAGMRNTATWALGRESYLGRELDVAATRDDDRSAVLGRVADDRDDDGGDEELAHPGGLGEHLERADEDLGDEGRDERRRAEHEQ